MEILKALHPLKQLQPLFIQHVALSQLADCVLQSQEFLQVPTVSLLQHFDLLLQLRHDRLQLLLTQTVPVVAVH